MFASSLWICLWCAQMVLDREDPGSSQWLQVTPFNLNNSSIDGVYSRLQTQLLSWQNGQAGSGAFNDLFQYTPCSVLARYFWNAPLWATSCAQSRQRKAAESQIRAAAWRKDTHSSHFPHFALGGIQTVPLFSRALARVLYQSGSLLDLTWFRN